MAPPPTPISIGTFVFTSRLNPPFILRRLKNDHHPYEANILQAYFDDLDHVHLPGIQELRYELGYPLPPPDENLFIDRFLDPWFHSAIMRPPTLNGRVRPSDYYPRPDLYGPVVTLVGMEDRLGNSKIVDNPEDLLPDTLVYRHKHTSRHGLEVAKNDTELWDRVVHLFLLRMAEDICNHEGRLEWLEENFSYKTANSSSTLVRYADPTNCELYSTIHTNVYLHLVEREVCRQCFIFLDTRGVIPPCSDQEAAYFIVCHLLTHQMFDEYAATHANNRRIAVELGAPNQYPPSIQEHVELIMQERAVSTRSQFFDSVTLLDDDLYEQPDSY